MKKYSSISILIPTLNAGRVLEKCLKTVSQQDYPKNKIEIIIADGGSTDNTLKIAKKYKAKIYKNKLKTAESGKAVCLKHATGELSVLLDSDNLLPNKNWLKTLIKPFLDKEILGTEPWKFTYRKQDTLVNRYCALIGANDPYCYFVGNYDKFSFLSNKWTGLKLEQEDKKEYIKTKILPKTILPTIGANGTVWRTKILKQAVGKSKYLFDTDIPYTLAKQQSFYFAKVKIGIIHLYCNKISDFYRKQTRRAKDFFYLESSDERETTYQKQVFKQLYFIFSVILIFPLIFQAIRGYLRKPDKIWLLHPWFCLATLWIYGKETIISLFKKSPMSRKAWKQ